MTVPREPLTLVSRLNFATEILDFLPKMVPNRQATILAVAGVEYDAGAPVTSYARSLMALSDGILEELAAQAQLFALWYPPTSENQFSEDERGEFLLGARSVAEEIDMDLDLTPQERGHIGDLVTQLIRALEMAPKDGSKPVDTAAKAIVGDTAVNKPLWARMSDKKWARALVKLVFGITAAVGAFGGYPAIKEFAVDMGAWPQPGTAISAPSEDVADVEGDIVDAEEIPESEE